MHARHDKVKLCKNLIGIIQRPFGENVRLDAFEDAKALVIPLIKTIDLGMLSNYLIKRQSACIMR